MLNKIMDPSDLFTFDANQVNYEYLMAMAKMFFKLKGN